MNSGQFDDWESQFLDGRLAAVRRLLLAISYAKFGSQTLQGKNHFGIGFPVVKLASAGHQMLFVPLGSVCLAFSGVLSQC